MTENKKLCPECEGTGISLGKPCFECSNMPETPKPKMKRNTPHYKELFKNTQAAYEECIEAYDELSRKLAEATKPKPSWLRRLLGWK